MNTIIKAVVTTAIFAMSSVAVAECDVNSAFSGCSDEAYEGPSTPADEASVNLASTLANWQAGGVGVQSILALVNNEELPFERADKSWAYYIVEANALVVGNVSIREAGEEDVIVDRAIFVVDGNGAFHLQEYVLNGVKFNVR